MEFDALICAKKWYVALNCSENHWVSFVEIACVCVFKRTMKLGSSFRNPLNGFCCNMKNKIIHYFLLNEIIVNNFGLIRSKRLIGFGYLSFSCKNVKIKIYRSNSMVLNCVIFVTARIFPLDFAWMICIIVYGSEPMAPVSSRLWCTVCKAK